MKTPAILVAAVMVIATAGQLQAGIINGDFETGNLAGWTAFETTNGVIGTPAVVSFDVTGSGPSLAGRFNVGQDNFTSGIQRGGGIFQDFMHAGGDLTVSLDIASATPPNQENLSGGVFSLLIDGVVIDSHNFGTIGVNTTERSSLFGVVNGLATGSHEYRILITRPYVTTLGVTPFQYVDNAVASSSGQGQVPEPASLAIFDTIGLVACGRRRSRKS